MLKDESDRRKYNFDADDSNNADKKICIRCLIRVIRAIRVKKSCLFILICVYQTQTSYVKLFL